MRSRAKTRHLPDDGRPPILTTCTWWIHLKELTTMIKKIQSRINLLRHSQSVGVSGAALSHVMEKTTIPAREKTILRTMPKIMKTPLR